jgi:hypothetical protein
MAGLAKGIEMRYYDRRLLLLVLRREDLDLSFYG